MKKIIVLTLCLLPIVIFAKQKLLFNNLQINYFHSNEKNQTQGNSVEYHFQQDNFYYILTLLYDKKQQLYKKRRLKLDASNKLLNSYEKNFKENIIVFNQYLAEKSIFYKKTKKPEIQKTRVLTLDYLALKLRAKITNKHLKKENWLIHAPHTPIINEILLTIDCKEKNKNPYFGKKEPAIVCHIYPKSRAIRLALGKKAQTIFVFQKSYPHLLLTLVIGQKKYFYITNYQKIYKKREFLLQNLAEIDQDIIKNFLN